MMTDTQATLFVLNGPNLNLLGLRQPDVHGVDTLADIEAACRDTARAYGFDVVFRQSNVEGDLVSWVQEARSEAAGLILNAGAYAHTSLALHDALCAVDIPAIEVHLDNFFKRDVSRRSSAISAAVTGVIGGLGAESYLLAIAALARILEKE